MGPRCSYVIYEQPADMFPRFVMRRWILAPAPTGPGLYEDTLGGSPWDAETVEGLRMLIPGNLTRVPRSAEDSELVVETWM